MVKSNCFIKIILLSSRSTNNCLSIFSKLFKSWRNTSSNAHNDNKNTTKTL